MLQYFQFQGVVSAPLKTRRASVSNIGTPRWQKIGRTSRAVVSIGLVIKIQGRSNLSEMCVNTDHLKRLKANNFGCHFLSFMGKLWQTSPTAKGQNIHVYTTCYYFIDYCFFSFLILYLL